MVLELQKQQFITQTGSVQTGQIEASNTNMPNSVVRLIRSMNYVYYVAWML